MFILTGGAGFIGSCLLEALNRRGVVDIIVVDHLAKSEKWKNLSGKQFVDYIDKAEFISQVKSQKFSWDGVKTIIHLGACSSTQEKDFDYLLANNFDYTKTLAKEALNRNIRFIYASSAATYGNGDVGYSDDESQISKLRPLNPYGYSKQLFDQWAKEKSLFSKVVGLKFFNVFGPNEYHKGEMRSLVLKGYHQILTTGKLRLFRSNRPTFKDGEQSRDFIYVKDVVSMMLHIIDRPKISGLYNIGSGWATTWNRLANGIFHALDRPVNIEYIELPHEIEQTYQYHTMAEMNKLVAAGYNSEIASVEKSIDDYVKNYLVPNRYL